MRREPIVKVFVGLIALWILAMYMAGCGNDPVGPTPEPPAPVPPPVPVPENRSVGITDFTQWQRSAVTPSARVELVMYQFGIVNTGDTTLEDWGIDGYITAPGYDYAKDYTTGDKNNEGPPAPDLAPGESGHVTMGWGYKTRPYQPWSPGLQKWFKGGQVGDLVFTFKGWTKNCQTPDCGAYNPIPFPIEVSSILDLQPQIR